MTKENKKKKEYNTRNTCIKTKMNQRKKRSRTKKQCAELQEQIF
jgi:hypothetical protein